MGKEREVGILRTQLEKKKRTPEETAELLDMPLGYIQKIANILQVYAGESDLQIAEKLLREGQLSVAEIAAKIGYINPNKFTSAFCSEYKMTPTEYKKDVQMDRK